MGKAGSHIGERDIRITSDRRGALRSVEFPAAREESLRGITEHTLFDLYDRMLGDIEIPAVLRDVADVVRQNFHCERASIYLIDATTDELESVAVIGNVARTIRVPISRSSLAGFCAKTRRTFLVPDAYGDLSGIDPGLRFDRKWDELNNFRTRDVMCAPALFRDEVVGVVQVINSKDHPFRESDLAPLRIASRLIGYALYHARIYDDLATLKQLEKQKAQFMRVMVHELKSPVAGAKMMADALQYHQSIAGTPAIDVTRKIADRMGRLTSLIKDLLELASVKSGDPLGEISIVDLVQITEECCEPYREQAEQKSLTLTMDVPAEPLRVRFDSQGYRLVLSNLVSNAVKYTPSGSVSVRLKQDNDWAVLEVADTGMGIPDADVPKLFTEFFRASNAKANDIEGSGVGLSGAKALVERFGGEFSLRTKENEGSTFVVRLPLHHGDESLG